MGVATVQVGPSINAPFDGTMGFSKAPLSETDNSTVVDRLYEQGQIKKRMACLKLHTQNEEKDSEMIIGGCDVEADYWLPVLGESYWAVTLTKIILRSPTDNTELLSLDVNVQAVLDTGDPNSLHLPERFVNPLNDKLGGSWNGNHYIVDCDTRKSFPNMELYFGEAKITFTTDDYSWLYFDECQLALKPRTYDEVLVPLQFFFKATVILDSGNNRVGLANIK
ncbi:pepsin A-like [Sitodiplosis mosellana]|uniref:pepsin A-like n=1 Tax=Sitodiplosis mosellana TaxID=263140 RepID=UPI002443C83B|nr:pepsin A-like [Sitodiplosis mosellana]